MHLRYIAIFSGPTSPSLPTMLSTYFAIPSLLTTNFATLKLCFVATHTLVSSASFSKRSLGTYKLFSLSFSKDFSSSSSMILDNILNFSISVLQSLTIALFIVSHSITSPSLISLALTLLHCTGSKVSVESKSNITTLSKLFTNCINLLIQYLDSFLALSKYALQLLDSLPNLSIAFKICTKFFAGSRKSVSLFRGFIKMFLAM